MNQRLWRRIKWTESWNAGWHSAHRFSLLASPGRGHKTFTAGSEAQSLNLPRQDRPVDVEELARVRLLPSLVEQLDETRRRLLRRQHVAKVRHGRARLLRVLLKHITANQARVAHEGVDLGVFEGDPSDSRVDGSLGDGIGADREGDERNRRDRAGDGRDSDEMWRGGL